MPRMTKRRVLLLAIADAMEVAIPICRETAAKADDIAEIEAALNPVSDAVRALASHWRALAVGHPILRHSRERARRAREYREAKDAEPIDWPTGIVSQEGGSL